MERGTKLIIGICGFAQSGKSTIADYIAEAYKFKKKAYADKLREACTVLNPIVGKTDNWGGVVRYNDLLRDFGYEAAKTDSRYGAEFRRILIYMGTEVGRRILGGDIWVNALYKDIDLMDNVVISDVRFNNEARAIRDRGGRILKVTRPGVVAAIDHTSETEHLRWTHDGKIENNSTVNELHSRVDDWMKIWGISKK